MRADRYLPLAAEVQSIANVADPRRGRDLTDGRNNLFEFVRLEHDPLLPQQLLISLSIELVEVKVVLALESGVGLSLFTAELNPRRPITSPA